MRRVSAGGESAQRTGARLATSFHARRRTRKPASSQVRGGRGIALVVAAGARDRRSCPARRQPLRRARARRLRARAVAPVTRTFGCGSGRPDERMSSYKTVHELAAACGAVARIRRPRAAGHGCRAGRGTSEHGIDSGEVEHVQRSARSRARAARACDAIPARSRRVRATVVTGDPVPVGDVAGHERCGTCALRARRGATLPSGTVGPRLCYRGVRCPTDPPRSGGRARNLLRTPSQQHGSCHAPRSGGARPRRHLSESGVERRSSRGRQTATSSRPMARS